MVDFSSQPRSAGAGNLLLKLAERDVAAAVSAAIEGERADAYALIATLATADPETVWRAVAQMGDPLARTEYQGAVASVWLAHDPARAFATVVSLPAGWSREQLLRQSAWALARRDPQQAIELVRTLPNSERRELYSAVVQQWSRHDPAAAAEWIEAQDVQMQGALAFQIANAYVAQQPEEALAWAPRISRSPGRNLWSHMTGQIAMYDPQDALRRAQAAENPAQRAQALGRAIASIAARDPQLATAYLDKLPPGNVRSNAVAEVARQVAQSRPHSAVDWLRDLPDAGMLMAAVNAVASQLAQTDVNAAAQMIDRVPKELRAAWVEDVALAYAQVDIERGLEWLRRWGDEAPHVANNFVHNIAIRDLDAGVKVIERLAEDAERDQMLTNVMGTVAMRSPKTALEHLPDIDDDRMRMQATAVVAGAWGQTDPTGARKWATSLQPDARCRTHAAHSQHAVSRGAHFAAGTDSIARAARCGRVRRRRSHGAQRPRRHARTAAPIPARSAATAATRHDDEIGNALPRQYRRLLSRRSRSGGRANLVRGVRE